MSYQVLARKWRPQRFDDVVGQQPVTRTLRNAVASGRIAHAFVFAGSRGCGKTTTARILARALNCVQGPTPDPCGVCDACVEIAQGRDIDVLEIDAASHTGIDNIREVVIAGLAISPVRDRFKVFIIDEVHQLSTQSFNALLKSIEEPPPHVVFMMATTELHKIPDTILSRSQVFEFRTIPMKAIVAQLRKIADAEPLQVPDEALLMIARFAEGSMRDAQSALDQVIAFAGRTITTEDVSTVLGLVGRDLLFELIEAVVDEDAPRAFALADRAVESGQDLKLVCRELSRVVRDILILAVDPSRAGDGELGEGELERLEQLGKRFSREDLMRAFELLAETEQEIRTASHPRYHFEMALLRWMHLRKLVPLTDLMEQLGGGAPVRRAGSTGSPGKEPGPARMPASAAEPVRRPGPAPVPEPARGPAPAAPAPESVRRPGPSGSPGKDPASAKTPASSAPAAPASNVKDAFLSEVRAGKGLFYHTVVAQAQRIDVTDDRITFAFLPAHRALREQFDQARGWLEVVAERVRGRKMSVVATQAVVDAGEPSSAPADGDGAKKSTPADDLKAEALNSSAVQAMLDVFPGEIRNVEEM